MKVILFVFAGLALVGLVGGLSLLPRIVNRDLLAEAIQKRESREVPPDLFGVKGFSRDELLRIRRENIRKQLVNAPRLGEIVGASILMTDDTQTVTITLVAVDGRQYTLWTDGHFTTRESRTWIGSGDPPAVLPVHTQTIMEQAHVNSISHY